MFSPQVIAEVGVRHFLLIGGQKFDMDSQVGPFMPIILVLAGGLFFGTLVLLQASWRWCGKKIKTSIAGAVIEVDAVVHQDDWAERAGGTPGKYIVEAEVIAHHYNCPALPGGQIFRTDPISPCTCPLVKNMPIFVMGNGQPRKSL